MVLTGRKQPVDRVRPWSRACWAPWRPLCGAEPKRWAPPSRTRRSPRGRWYLNDRPTNRTPLASKAEASVSPGCPVSHRWFHWNLRVRLRSIWPPAIRNGWLIETVPLPEPHRAQVRHARFHGSACFGSQPATSGRPARGTKARDESLPGCHADRHSRASRHPWRISPLGPVKEAGVALVDELHRVPRAKEGVIDDHRRVLLSAGLAGRPAPRSSIGGRFMNRSSRKAVATVMRSVGGEEMGVAKARSRAWP